VVGTTKTASGPGVPRHPLNLEALVSERRGSLYLTSTGVPTDFSCFAQAIRCCSSEPLTVSPPIEKTCASQQQYAAW